MSFEAMIVGREKERARRRCQREGRGALKLLIWLSAGGFLYVSSPENRRGGRVDGRKVMYLYMYMYM